MEITYFFIDFFAVHQYNFKPKFLYFCKTNEMYLDRKTRLFTPGGQNIPRDSEREQSEGGEGSPMDSGLHTREYRNYRKLYYYICPNWNNQ